VVAPTVADGLRRSRANRANTAPTTTEAKGRVHPRGRRHRPLKGNADRDALGSNVVDYVAEDGSNNIAIAVDVDDLPALQGGLVPLRSNSRTAAQILERPVRIRAAEQRWRRRESNPRPQPHRLSVYKRRLPFRFARRPGCSRPTDALADPLVSRFGRSALPPRRARSLAPPPSHGQTRGGVAG
jgi:hypothetical protein